MSFKSNTILSILSTCLLFSCSKDDEPVIDPSLILPTDVTFFSTRPDEGQLDVLFQVDLLGTKENIITSNLTAELNVTRTFDRYRNGNDFVFWSQEDGMAFKNIASNESVNVKTFCDYVPNPSSWSFASTENFIIAAESTEDNELIIHRSSKSLDGATCTSSVIAEGIFRFGSLRSGSFLLSRGNQVIFSYATSEEAYSLYTYNVENNRIDGSVSINKEAKIASNGTSVFVFNTDDTFKRYDFNLSEESTGAFAYQLVNGFEAKIDGNKMLVPQSQPAAGGHLSIPAIYNLDENKLIAGETGFNIRRVLTEIAISGTLVSQAVDLANEIIVFGYELDQPMPDPDSVLPIVGRILYVNYEGRILQIVDTELIPSQMIIR